MFRKILAIVLFSVGAQADYVGFSHGSEFTAASLEGNVHVTCNGFNGIGTATYTCRDTVLEPQIYDHFVGPKDARGAELELRATREDGSVRTKTSDYEGAKGVSSDSFNLWISTLFQKPLLQAGVNTVEYRITTADRSKALVSSGSFTVKVSRSGLRRCPAATYNSVDVNDCNSPYSICQRYFEEFNNCK